jgi:hypothetical protein
MSCLAQFPNQAETFVVDFRNVILPVEMNPAVHCHRQGAQPFLHPWRAKGIGLVVFEAAHAFRVNPIPGGLGIEKSEF